MEIHMRGRAYRADRKSAVHIPPNKNMNSHSSIDHNETVILHFKLYYYSN